ncbi:MAG: type I secretion system permease/ATPase [Pseudomonadota bacterium]
MTSIAGVVAGSGGRRSFSAVGRVLASSIGSLLTLVGISGVINVLMLTGALFMMQVYDRVLASHSIPTLVALALMATVAYLFQGGLDIVRSRVLTLIGERVDDEIGPQVHAAVARQPLRSAGQPQEALQPFRDLEALRGFLSGSGPIALFDLPWMPVYIAVCYLLHPILGLSALAGAIILVCLTLLTEILSFSPTRRALAAQSERNLSADDALRGAEVIQAMGMWPQLAARWREPHLAHLSAQRQASFIVGTLGSISKMLRMILQSAVLGLGAYLAIKGDISPGSIIAASILSARALAPVDQAIASWRAFVAARGGYRRLNDLLAPSQRPAAAFDLPRPSRSVATDGLIVAAPGSSHPIVKRLSMRLEAGQALGVIGSSASGKSSLVRALTGAWSPLAGKVTIDGASLDQWDPVRLGPAIGYLPQDVQLFAGTIAENIARFEEKPDAEAVIEAARMAGFHDHVLAFPQGYMTRIGHGGVQLSAGQKQRIGLARALYRDPFLVVLDEPNANLDSEGEAAVTAAIRAVRERGGIVVVVAHRPSAIAAVDLVLVMRNGEAAAFGPRDEVLTKAVVNHNQVVPRPAVVRNDGSRAAVAAIAEGA